MSKTVEKTYRVRIVFHPRFESGRDGVFTFYLNEPENMHSKYLWQMLKAAACERYQIPFISENFGQDLMSIMKTYKVLDVGRALSDE